MTLIAAPAPIDTEDGGLEDPLTEDDTRRILTAIVAAAGPTGISQDDILPQYQVICAEIGGLKIGASIYEGFARDLLIPFVGVDGEVAWCVPEHFEAATEHLRKDASP